MAQITERRQAELEIAEEIRKIDVEIAKLENVVENTFNTPRRRLAQRNLWSLQDMREELWLQTCELEAVQQC